MRQLRHDRRCRLCVVIARVVLQLQLEIGLVLRKVVAAGGFYELDRLLAKRLILVEEPREKEGYEPRLLRVQIGAVHLAEPACDAAHSSAADGDRGVA